MSKSTRTTTHCLTHQLPEDQTSSIGLVCRECKQHLEAAPQRGRCMSFWESQPAAYTLNRQPLFVYTIIWDDFRIRSLHPPDSDVDRRSPRYRRDVPAPHGDAWDDGSPSDGKRQWDDDEWGLFDGFDDESDPSV